MELMSVISVWRWKWIWIWKTHHLMHHIVAFFQTHAATLEPYGCVMGPSWTECVHSKVSTIVVNHLGECLLFRCLIKTKNDLFKDKTRFSNISNESTELCAIHTASKWLQDLSFLVEDVFVAGTWSFHENGKIIFTCHVRTCVKRKPYLLKFNILHLNCIQPTVVIFTSLIDSNCIIRHIKVINFEFVDEISWWIHWSTGWN